MKLGNKWKRQKGKEVSCTFPAHVLQILHHTVVIRTVSYLADFDFRACGVFEEHVLQLYAALGAGCRSFSGLRQPVNR